MRTPLGEPWSGRTRYGAAVYLYNLGWMEPEALDLFVPALRPHNHRTILNRLATVADQIEKCDAASPYRVSRADAAPISVFIDGAYIRAVPGYQSRHFEIAMGRVVSPKRPPRQFAAAPHMAIGKHDVVRAAMRAQGWLPGRDVTVFSDGDQRSLNRA